jgi:alkanesulfonate monooxygenase SsuD/methylene tetrahydromethanopterin reductase-like flavin-dependent oxidoreductase (luciferase family)
MPQSLSRPHPPIMIAGDGAKKTLRLVAGYADACNLHPDPKIPEKLEVLRGHCEAEGRDYGEIEKTCAFGFDIGERDEKTEEVIDQLRWLAGTVPVIVLQCGRRQRLAASRDQSLKGNSSSAGTPGRKARGALTPRHGLTDVVANSSLRRWPLPVRPFRPEPPLRTERAPRRPSGSVVPT